MNPKPSLVGISLVFSVIGSLLTLVLYWLNIWPYFVAAVFAIIVVAAFASSKTEHPKDWPKNGEWSFVVAAVISVVTGIYLNSGDKADRPAITSQLPRERALPAHTQQIRSKLPQPQAVVVEQLQPQANQIKQPRPKKMVVTDVDDILDTYEANQIGGLKKFGDATIKIGGTVVRVREVFGLGVIVLRSSKTNRNMEILFSAEATPDLARLMPGNNIEATCPTVMEAMSAVLIRDCSAVLVK